MRAQLCERGLRIPRAISRSCMARLASTTWLRSIFRFCRYRRAGMGRCPFSDRTVSGELCESGSYHIVAVIEPFCCFRNPILQRILLPTLSRLSTSVKTNAAMKAACQSSYLCRKHSLSNNVQETIRSATTTSATLKQIKSDPHVVPYLAFHWHWCFV